MSERKTSPPPKTVNSQINYYRDYTIEESEIDNLKIEFESEEKKAKFELALLNKIWNQNKTELPGYTVKIRDTDYVVHYRYCTNKDDIVGSNKIFGITHISDQLNGSNTAQNAFQKGYFFIYTYSELHTKGILRVHEIVRTSNYGLRYTDDYSTDANVTPSPCYGLYHYDNPNGLKNGYPIIGFKDNYFYLPIKSYCMQGRHENVVKFREDYAGRFEIMNPSIKVTN